MKKLLLIGGPTGVGKTELALKLQKLFNGKLISCDSMQIYKDMNIGTSKIDIKQYPHKLIDIISPSDEFSVFDYKNYALKEIEKAYLENKLPIIVGGTGLYMKALLFPLSFNNSTKNLKLRTYYENLAIEKGNEFVFNILKEKDESLTKNLHPNNLKRVIRKLEILDNGECKTDELKSEFDYELIVLNLDREVLYEKINNRVDEMFSMGLENEVKSVVQKYNLTRESQSMQAIGYREFFDYFEGKISLEDVKSLIKQHTRNYAKRQLTWFKTMPNAKFFDIKDQENIIKYLKTHF